MNGKVVVGGYTSQFFESNLHQPICFEDRCKVVLILKLCSLLSRLHVQVQML